MTVSGLPHLLAATALALTGLAGATAPATATGDAAVTCRVGDYTPTVTRGAFQHAPARVAQIATHTYPAGYQHYGYFRLRDVDVFRTGVRIGGHLDKAVGNRYARQLERRYREPFRPSGVLSTDGKAGVKSGVNNVTKHRVTVVYFRGAADVITAPVFVTSCRDDDGGSPALGHVHRSTHRFVTFGHFSDGGIQCGSGLRYVDEVGRAAARQGCP